MGAGRSLIEQITLEDLPVLAEHLATLKCEGRFRSEGTEPLKQFVLMLDEQVCEWDFTIAIVLRLQTALDEMNESEAERWGHERPVTFLRRLAALNDLTPEGEEARKHFGNFVAIANAARQHIEREDHEN